MTTNNFIGFFSDKEKLYKAENSLKIAGIKPQNLIVQEEQHAPLMIAVRLQDQYDLQMAQNIFKFYQVHHTEEITSPLNDADELRRIISIHSRQQIFDGNTRVNRHNFHEGMNAEVHTFGND